VAAIGQEDSTVQKPPVQKPLSKPAIRTSKPTVNVVRQPRVDSAAIDSIDVVAKQIAKHIVDSVQASQLIPQNNGIDSIYIKLLDNPYLQMKQPPVYLVIKERVRVDKDQMFYLLSGLMMLLAFIKLVFSRYFTNIFRLFFQPSFRQKQTREQLQQSNLPSLLLNLFFILTGGAFIALLINYYTATDRSFWLLFLYSTISLLALYSAKYVFITFAGWVFNVKEASETYMFVVYLINKILGVLLIPITWLVAFAKPELVSVSITVSLILVAILFVYRYVVSFGLARREVKVSPLHFLFYVLAFELTPLLLIYKTLIIYLEKSL
jgi:hypothetical protein